MSAKWEAIVHGDLDAIGAAIFERMAGQRDDPSSREQEMADAALALIERCKATGARLEAAEALLREVNNGLGSGDVCPVCGAVTLFERNGPREPAHLGICPLAAFLKEDALSAARVSQRERGH